MMAPEAEAGGREGKPRVVVIGPRIIPGDVPGGTKVSFEALLEDFSRNGAFAVVVIDTARPLMGRRALARAILNAKTLVMTVITLFRSLPADAVMFNTSAKGALLSGPAVWALTRFRRTPLVVRFFGSDFGEALRRAPALARWLARRTFLRGRRLLFQTPDLCERFDDVPGATYFPTTREFDPCPEPRAEECTRFLFLAQLRPEKGVVEAIDAAAHLAGRCSLTVYGPVMAGTDVTRFDNQERVRYQGTAAPEDVADILCAHDALVFPTYYAGEGIPGVVIEAMQSGLPVVATDWKMLSKLVPHEQAGLIVPARSAEALAAAMHRLANDPELFRRLRAGALQRGRDFRRSYWHRQLEHWLRSEQ